ncbi:MAG: PrgI family protein [Candidatus Pacebacteria bacterium]|nr:PrgI family protein [Candidatus Paceibacterota bacterium]PIR63225.1 MAG: hypothetical protein COU64_05915 [Candidatus Pacebacteria bacterium CG10_big_fil_rev_8_21_14_0_10_40_26]PIZ78255.1 MAG: hypothetical protein COY01_05735 [Candidatus Pacebacteria bacterium CG_4_10_14_0_2_um_filter_40_20]PJA68700.1 MAG: hypothetical protein CO156_04310 [Candidatus Pacebacteria bacterium CG_4_9_14_3_um_filter_40_12]PJC41640.1 MAG: hypothetical protein CO041_02900 [Candidatus Pacebacteria bacterium CG_4_9_1
MRSRVIPAQITTVEDKIAGDFSLTQIMLLLLPVLIASFIYAILPPSMSFVLYKLILASIFAIASITLAIRVKGRIIASWLVVLIRYNIRPKYYVFNKNSATNREIIQPEVEIITVEEKETKSADLKSIQNLDIKDILKLRHILDTTDFNLTYRSGKKGGLNVAFEKVS